jgi:hypothetical protein
MGTLPGRIYVLTMGTYGPPVLPSPYVLTMGTGCAHHGHGILFFAARGIDERFTVPFLEIAGWGMCSASEFGEAITCRDSATIDAKKSRACLAQEAEVFVLRVPADD